MVWFRLVTSRFLASPKVSKHIKGYKGRFFFKMGQYKIIRTFSEQSSSTRQRAHLQIFGNDSFDQATNTLVRFLVVEICAEKISSNFVVFQFVALKNIYYKAFFLTLFFFGTPVVPLFQMFFSRQNGLASLWYRLGLGCFLIFCY